MNQASDSAATRRPMLPNAVDRLFGQQERLIRLALLGQLDKRDRLEQLRPLTPPPPRSASHLLCRSPATHHMHHWE